MTFKTADLSDDNEGRVQVVEPGLRDFGGIRRFHGEIVTIRADGDFSRVREQVNLDGSGKVLVIDNDASLDCALLGDLLAAAANSNGWQGVVVNGCIRDSADIGDMDIGVKALATNPARGARQGRGNVNVELGFLGANFRPGEQLYSDEDGILLSETALF
ncbi:MAG: ribonuclease E activity regulator RraA [Gammaproteobacteria bacterium]|nr:ribonuclease E activity regulator RraA [Gammaproteobacteria bacterium]